MAQLLPHILQSHLSTIQAVCQDRGVKRLWVFGSVLRDDFRPDSDIDFLYEWATGISEEDYLDNLFSILDELEELLGHPVDWIEASSVRNPYLKSEIETSRVLLYEQDSEKVSV